MTIDEAIGVLEKELIPFAGKPVPALRDALKLGIEALKRVKDYRHTLKETFYYLLPGEEVEP